MTFANIEADVLAGAWARRAGWQVGTYLLAMPTSNLLVVRRADGSVGPWDRVGRTVADWSLVQDASPAPSGQE